MNGQIGNGLVKNGRVIMTEKRFTFTQDTLAKADVFDGDEFVCCTLSVWVKQLVDLLNQLNDENEQLKHECNYLQNRLDDFINIQNENKQLKEIRDVAFELAERPTQHTLWKFRRFLKEYNRMGNVK